MQPNNLAIVEAAYAAFLKGDIPYVLSTLSPDVEWVEPGAPAIPSAGVYHGVDEVASFFATLDEATEVLVFEPRDFLTANETVGVFGYWRARARRTGRVFESDWAMFFRFP
jgi:ketosteroid isomerase-like protein